MGFIFNGNVLVALVCVNIFTSTDQAKAKESTIFNASATILFVGNSLTYTNDLPGMIVKEGKKNGVDIKTTILAFPNYSLEDHWNDGDLQKLVDENHYDFVVVQQGPSSQEEGRATLLDFGTKIKSLCKKNNAQLAFFMVWPSFLNIETFKSVIKNYTEAATSTGSLLCDVGGQWRLYCLVTSDYSFYGPDMFHPSYRGSEFAAGIIYQTLFNDSSKLNVKK